MKQKINIKKESLFNDSSKEKHIIKDVPYVGQKNSIFCSYACQTMLFKYYYKKISFEDLIYNSGVGYSLCYAHDSLKYLPFSGTYLSQWPLDRKFVSSLYGLEYEVWRPTDLSNPSYEIFNVYWEKIKEYIKNDKPVSTAVDVLLLPQTIELINLNLWVNAKKIPKVIQRLISTTHEIVIVGFDEEKKVIYYNDPVASVLGDAKSGTYATASLYNFISAVMNIRGDFFNPRFIINTYKKVKNPISDEMIFKKSHERNIEKIKGNPLYYDEKWEKYPLGINALEAFIKNFKNTPEDKISELLSLYRTESFKNAVMKKIFVLLADKSNKKKCEDSFNDPFDIILIEKGYAYEYIRNKSKNYEGLNDEIELIGKELKLWKSLSDSYVKFYKNLTPSKKKTKMMINNNFTRAFSEILEIEKNIGKSY